MIKRILFTAVLFFFVSASLVSEPQFYISGAPSKFWAAELELGFARLGLVEGRDSRVFIGTEVNYGNSSYYRRPDGTFYLPGDSDFDESLAEFNRLQISWRSGFAQGILPPKNEANDILEAGIEYQGYYFTGLGDLDGKYIQEAGLPEADSFVQHALLLSLTYDEAITNSYSVIRGVEALAEIEYAPSALNAYADYVHSSLQVNAYIPLFNAEPEAGNNIFSSYLANSTGMRYLWYGSAPVEEGLSKDIGVRGIETPRFAVPFVVSNRTDIRFGLTAPAIAFLFITPSFLLFTDVGYYYENADYSGIIVSHGAALYLNILDLVQIGGRLSILSLGEKMDESMFTPFELQVFYAF